jgi:hypothetical protein
MSSRLRVMVLVRLSRLLLDSLAKLMSAGRMDSAILGGLEGLEKGRREGMGRACTELTRLWGVKVVVRRLTAVDTLGRLVAADSWLLILLRLINLDGCNPVMRIIFESIEVLSRERRVCEDVVTAS